MNKTIFIFSTVEEPSLWVGSDRDYTYDELLLRVFNIMREKNPDMVAGKKQKFVMRPPQVVRIGTKKTSFANFTEVKIILLSFRMIICLRKLLISILKLVINVNTRNVDCYLIFMKCIKKYFLK